MLQQVTITTPDAKKFKPLLQSAIRSELKTLRYGIVRTRERLTDFEEQFAMSTMEFEQKFGAGKLEETLDFIEWWGEIKTLDLLEDKQQSLESARVR